MKQYEFGLVCGRFQTFHLGHEKLIDTALSMCEKVLVFIGSAQESNTERNPYDAEFRKRILRAVYGEREDLIFKDLEDLTDENDITPEWGRYVLDHAVEVFGRKPDVIVYGNDEERGRWFSKEDVEGIDEYEIPRGNIPISATMVRQMMIDDDRMSWERWVDPKIYPFYDEMREKLLEVEKGDLKMKNIFQMTTIVKKNDGTERKNFKVIQVKSYEGFLEAIWHFARVNGLSGYKKSRRTKIKYEQRKMHKHFYKNGVIRVQPLKIEIYD